MVVASIVLIVALLATCYVLEKVSDYVSKKNDEK